MIHLVCDECERPPEACNCPMGIRPLPLRPADQPSIRRPPAPTRPLPPVPTPHPRENT